MAYVKTTWVDNTTPEIDDDNLNKMENGIFTADANATTANTNIGTIGSLTTTATNLVGAVNEVNAKAIKLENVTKYVAVTADANGDFKCTLTNTLATNMILNLIFPTATDNTKVARISIDNGSNYKNIKALTTNIVSKDVESLKQTVFYDGTDFRIIDNLVDLNVSASGIIATNEFLSSKRVYKKLFTGQMANASSATQNLFSFSSITGYTNIWCDTSLSFVYSANETLSLNWFYTTTDYSRLWLAKNTGYARLRTGGDLSAFTYHIVLAYTL